MYCETFEYEIKFDYDNGFDRKFKKFITADSAEEMQKGVDMVIRKLFANGLVSSQNLRDIEAIPKSDADAEKTTFGKFLYHSDQAIKQFFSS